MDIAEVDIYDGNFINIQQLSRALPALGQGERELPLKLSEDTQADIARLSKLFVNGLGGMKSDTSGYDKVFVKNHVPLPGEITDLIGRQEMRAIREAVLRIVDAADAEFAISVRDAEHGLVAIMQRLIRLHFGDAGNNKTHDRDTRTTMGAALNIGADVDVKDEERPVPLSSLSWAERKKQIGKRLADLERAVKASRFAVMNTESFNEFMSSFAEVGLSQELVNLNASLWNKVRTLTKDRFVQEQTYGVMLKRLKNVDLDVVDIARAKVVELTNSLTAAKNIQEYGAVINDFMKD